MSIIKELAIYDGFEWKIDEIGADANNIDLITNVAGQNNVQSALSALCGTSALTATRMVTTSSTGKLTTTKPIEDRALYSAVGSGIPTASRVTSTELNYLSGVTSNIQEQLNKKLHINRYYSGTYNLNTLISSTYFGDSCTISNKPSADSTTYGGTCLMFNTYLTNDEDDYRGRYRQFWLPGGSNAVYTRYGLITSSTTSTVTWTSWVQL